VLQKGLVGKARGKGPAEAAQEHQSTPLSSLKDPLSFAPPPKRLDYSAGPPAVPARPAKQGLQAREEEEAKPAAIRPRATPPPPTTTASRPKPSLPPRLPPRQNSNPNEYATLPPPTYNEATQQGTPAQGVLNQGALGRLGQAGVSVPGFGIGRTASPPVPPRANPCPPVPPRQNPSSNAILPPPAASGHGSQMNELQDRFAKMSGPKSPAPPPATGTSWTDKQAALRTASSLRDDPSKVSASDLKGAASTASNFQQRHGEQVASGWKSANSLNQKFGITGRVNNFASSSASPAPAPSPAPSSQGGLGKKTPPPPPPKRTGLSDGSGSGEPPPIPLSSKPKF
jgi:hypothetical protein